MKAKLIFIFFLLLTINLVSKAADPGPLTSAQESIYWRAVSLYQEEEYYASLLLFQNLLDTSPENAELNFYAGMCCYNLDKPKLAKWHFSFASGDNCCRIKIMLLTRKSENENFLLSYNR